MGHGRHQAFSELSPCLGNKIIMIIVRTEQPHALQSVPGFGRWRDFSGVRRMELASAGTAGGEDVPCLVDPGLASCEREIISGKLYGQLRLSKVSTGVLSPV